MTTVKQGVLRPVSLRQRGAGLAIGVTAVLMATPATAQTTPAAQADDEVQLDTLKIEDRTADVSPYSQKGAPYKARVSGDERHTRPIAETPQTISVLTQSQILDSGNSDLRSILAAQPGITIGTGENGNAFGDRYIIRGQEAKSDVFVDGLRDPGMTIRESFAVEQIEISKGPNSSFAGRGTSGGAINAITKAASTGYDFGKVGVGVGTDRYVRTTADINLRASDTFAVRGNVLYAHQNVPDRAPADRERKGLALSALYQPDSRLSLTLDYYGLRADDNPDLGGYLITNAATGVRAPARNVPSYVQNEDFLKSKVDTVTGRIRYEFTPDIFLTNIIRYGASDNSYVTTGASGRTTSTGNPAGVYATATLDNGHQGWQEVRYIANQFNLHINSDLLGGRNELILGGEYTKHKVDSGTYTRASQAAFNCRTGSGAGALDAFCITDANGNVVPNLNGLTQRVWTRNPFASRKWEVETISATVMDTVDLTPNLTLFLGGRVDHFKYDLSTFNAVTGAAAPFTGSTNNHADYSDTLWNGHAGITYKFGPGMVYFSAATAADVNGGESDTGTSSGYGGLVVFQGDAASAKPERSINLELGSKFELFDDRLLLTAAAFQITKSDVMEGADYDTIGTFNTGKLRVRGVEVELAGNITDNWSVQGGFTVMKSKVLESANVGLTTAQLALGATYVGKRLANFANFQAQFRTRYQVTEKFAMGTAVKHKSKIYGGQPDTGAVFTQSASGFTYNQPVPAYTVADLFFEYKFSNRIGLLVNVNNVTNEDYYTAVYRSGSFLYKGDARQVFGTLTVKF
ncbi:TonB-dependent receptor [Sphingobium subterraneum]|uniref:Catecholate siderophore receptor n=1 Tax=Sphingobium subterraneum TaxID=627688 RepID=A0A841IU10_9SPHN|nr:TonB-dependent receptor [Sphingobium subterraneum]MBB6122399.1 catecholate siderophore receptor [Sphingobium subterraneum]